MPSTFRWNPVAGCDDPATAIRRADGFANAVNMSGTEDASFWTAKASDLPAVPVPRRRAGRRGHAPGRPVGAGQRRAAEDILDQAGAGQWAAELAELRGEAQKTAATIKMVLSRALGFMTDPALARSVLPAASPAGSTSSAFLAGSRDACT